MKRLLPLLTLLSFALIAHAAPPGETQKHLGAASTWVHARITLEDVPPLGQGVSIAVEGSGRCVVREIDPVARTERRLEVVLSREEALSIFALAADRDVLATPEKAPPTPGEERASLSLENALGLTRVAEKGPKDKAPAFAEVALALHALEKRVLGKAPSYSGKLETSWRAFEGVSVTLSIYSGRPDPVFELVMPEDLALVSKALTDLPEIPAPAAKKEPPGLGYRGILLNPRGIPSLPLWVSVFEGTIQQGEDPRRVAHKKDAKGLEPWLKDEAKKRGFEIPK
jgi:hypothetical protein